MPVDVMRVNLLSQSVLFTVVTTYTHYCVYDLDFCEFFKRINVFNNTVSLTHWRLPASNFVRMVEKFRIDAMSHCVNYLFFHRISDAIVKEISLLSFPFSFRYFTWRVVCLHTYWKATCWLCNTIVRSSSWWSQSMEQKLKEHKKNPRKFQLSVPSISYQVDCLKVQRWIQKNFTWHLLSIHFLECLWRAFYARIYIVYSIHIFYTFFSSIFSSCVSITCSPTYLLTW